MQEFQIDLQLQLVFLLRLVSSALCGMVIGWERENKLKSAGIRTHMVVCMASALMMIISKYGFMDVVSCSSVHVEVSHIAAGVVQAIGFIGAGVIFVRGDNIIGLTTAAGLWATVGIGLAIGSGLYVLGFAATIFILLIQFTVHRKDHKSSFTEAGNIEINLSRHKLTLEEAEEKLSDFNVILKNASLSHNKEGESIFSASIFCSSSVSVFETVSGIIESSFVDRIQVYTID